jgi:hypothetical protein
LPKRFPPPWSVEDIGAAFVVRDHNEQALAYVYYEEEPGCNELCQVARAAKVATLLALTEQPMPKEKK